MSMDELSQADVLIKTSFASANHKNALAAHGLTEMVARRAKLCHQTLRQ
jgi:hypothetical protein